MALSDPHVQDRQQCLHGDPLAVTAFLEGKVTVHKEAFCVEWSGGHCGLRPCERSSCTISCEFTYKTVQCQIYTCNFGLGSAHTRYKLIHK
jgi:hypothetical protein